jgi:hypothetical protein
MREQLSAWMIQIGQLPLCSSSANIRPPSRAKGTERGRVVVRQHEKLISDLIVPSDATRQGDQYAAASGAERLVRGPGSAGPLALAPSPDTHAARVGDLIA